MATNEISKLKYDAEVLAEQATELESIASALADDKLALDKALDQLKDDWVSVAGDAFFETYETGWMSGVDDYVRMLQDLARALRIASNKYADLEDRYNKLSLE